MTVLVVWQLTPSSGSPDGGWSHEALTVRCTRPTAEGSALSMGVTRTPALQTPNANIPRPERGQSLLPKRVVQASIWRRCTPFNPLEQFYIRRRLPFPPKPSAGSRSLLTNSARPVAHTDGLIWRGWPRPPVGRPRFAYANRQTMMDAPVFVFENGCPDYVGLSLQHDGSNLPKTCTSRHDWRSTNRVAMSASDLRGLTIDVEWRF